MDCRNLAGESQLVKITQDCHKREIIIILNIIMTKFLRIA